MKINYLIMAAALLTAGSCSTGESYLQEIQVTNDLSKNHDLDNNDNFSPDGKWLVYDTRNEKTAIAGCSSIERVNIETGKTEVLYSIPDNHDYGPGAGAVSYHPFENKVIFIHGLPDCSPENHYQQWRRTGVIVDADRPGIGINMDSRDVTFKYSPGALRGGTHRHEWSRDGRFIGYTYNDAVMKKLEDSTGTKWNLRTIAVSNHLHKVEAVKGRSGENVEGTWFSAVVVRVVPEPRPGSDEISNAASDSWVGASGYRKTDGSVQRARAFLGRVSSKEGKPVDELFVVDIPEALNVPGEYGPLEGTRTSFPMPPEGTVQRRLTHTDKTNYPGCSGIVRSSSDGRYIAFCMRDINGIQQVFIISPMGGAAKQVTEHTSDVPGGVRWSPDNNKIIYLWDNSILICELSELPFEKRVRCLTARTDEAPSNIVLSNDGTTIAFNRFVRVPESDAKTKQIFIIK
jgi:dipeptidyl aminopeptidase/acylaminoacyl peptidase